MDAALWQSLGVSDDALGKLRLFAGLVEKWTQRINLIARSTVPELWARHVEDSARLCRHAPRAPGLWADFGSGGGFPGLVVACILADRNAPTRMTLVESDQRKAVFLREAARQMVLTVDVRSERAETMAVLSADVVSARALAPLKDLCAIADRHLAPGGLAIFPKGDAFEAEIAEARASWSFTLETAVNPGHKGAILCLRNIRRVRPESVA